MKALRAGKRCVRASPQRLDWIRLISVSSSEETGVVLSASRTVAIRWHYRESLRRIAASPRNSGSRVAEARRTDRAVGSHEVHTGPSLLCNEVNVPVRSQ